MSKFTIKAVLALLEIILALLAKIIRLVDTIRDLLDDKMINGSITYCSEKLDIFKSEITEWQESFGKEIMEIQNELD